MKTTKLKGLLMVFLLNFVLIANAQLDFGGTALPSRLGNANNWTLDTAASDDFNYTFNPTNNNADFGPSGQNKWNNFFHNGWEGPGATKWQRNHVAVSGGNLNLWASRRFFNDNTSTPYTKTFDFGGQNVTRPETISGCVTSKTRVIYPVFVEASLRIMNSTLATDIWLLSPDDKEEIDIIEAYGGAGSDGRNAYFAERIHLSHHVFIRPPNFRDYQPSDFNSWYRQSGVSQWGGRLVRIGVYWKSPTVLEYYIDGNLVRVLDNDAIASRTVNGTWEYTYPGGVTSTGQDGQLNRGADGFQSMTVSSTSSNFEQSRLNTAKNQSNISVIDPFNYLSNGRQFSREMDIIINVEDQSWQAAANRSPNNTEIQNFNDNLMLVDWIRVLKPNSGGGNNNGPLTCDTAPDYNGNANSYSPGDRVVNTSDNRLYERTATGWNLIEDCGGNNGGGNNPLVTLRKSNSTGFAIDGGPGGARGQNVYLWSYNQNNVNQQWIEINRGGGFYSYQKRNTNFCIDGSNGGANGNNVKLWDCNANNQNQQFRKINVNGNTRLQKRNASGFSIDGRGGGSNGQNVHMWSSNNNNGNQAWIITQIGTAKNGSLKDGISESESSVSIYPNPAVDYVNVSKNNFDTTADLTIIDVQGKVIYKNIFSGNTSKINTSSFNKGLYFVEIKTPKKTIIKKLIIK